MELGQISGNIGESSRYFLQVKSEEEFLYLVDFPIDFTVDTQAKVVVLMDMSLI